MEVTYVYSNCVNRLSRERSEERLVQNKHDVVVIDRNEEVANTVYQVGFPEI